MSEAMKLPSLHQIGDNVTLRATVGGVSFTDGGKVLYHVQMSPEVSMQFVPSELIFEGVKP